MVKASLLTIAIVVTLTIVEGKHTKENDGNFSPPENASAYYTDDLAEGESQLIRDLLLLDEELPLRETRSASWKLRAGKRADGLWKLRSGKREALWKLRSMKRSADEDDEPVDAAEDLEIAPDKRSALWKLRSMKRDALWKLRSGKRDPMWKLRTGKRSAEDV